MCLDLSLLTNCVCSVSVQVSEKETCSQTADTGSHATDLVASSSFNGPLTSGTGKKPHMFKFTVIYIIY